MCYERNTMEHLFDGSDMIKLATSIWFSTYTCSFLIFVWLYFIALVEILKGMRRNDFLGMQIAILTKNS